jgi:hypothetical protein
MTKRNSRPAVLHLRKLKGEHGSNLPSLSKARLKELIEQAIVDAYGEEEQAGGFFTIYETRRCGLPTWFHTRSSPPMPRTATFQP